MLSKLALNRLQVLKRPIVYPMSAAHRVVAIQMNFTFQLSDVELGIDFFFLLLLTFKGTWQWGGFSGVFAEIGFSWVPYTTFRAVPILASNWRRYSYSKNDSPHHRYGELAIEFFKRKLTVSMIRRVVDSPHQWYGESPTSCIVESVSWWLHGSVIRGFSGLLTAKPCL
jgi:hypothetical protein